MVSAVDRGNVELLWNFGARFLVLAAGNGGLEMLDARGMAVPATQVPRPSPGGRRGLVRRRRAGCGGGQFAGTLRLGDRTLTSTTGDWVVARWRADRTVSWVQTSPADKGARIERLATHPGGDLVVAGNFTGRVQFEGQVFVNGGANALFVARLAAATGAVVWSNAIQAPSGSRSNALAVTGDAVHLAVATPGEVSSRARPCAPPGVVVKYDAGKGALSSARCRSTRRC